MREISELYDLIIDIVLKRKLYDNNIQYLFQNKIADPNYDNGMSVSTYNLKK